MPVHQSAGKLATSRYAASVEKKARRPNICGEDAQVCWQKIDDGKSSKIPKYNKAKWRKIPNDANNSTPHGSRHSLQDKLVNHIKNQIKKQEHDEQPQPHRNTRMENQTYALI